MGVVAEILPWNGPFMMASQKVSAILAAGNTEVIKPSQDGSLSNLELAKQVVTGTNRQDTTFSQDTTFHRQTPTTDRAPGTGRPRKASAPGHGNGRDALPF